MTIPTLSQGLRGHAALAGVHGCDTMRPHTIETALGFITDTAVVLIQ